MFTLARPLSFQGQKGVSIQRQILTLEFNGVPEETSVSGERLMIETDKDGFRVGRLLNISCFHTHVTYSCTHFFVYLFFNIYLAVAVR